MEICEVKSNNKGLGAFSTQLYEPGALVLSEAPILVYPQASLVGEVCSHCLRDLSQSNQVLRCSGCDQANFCTVTCRDAAEMDSGSHCKVVCALLKACDTTGITSDEVFSGLHFLSRACGILVKACYGDEIARSKKDDLVALSNGNQNAILSSEDNSKAFQEMCARFEPALTHGLAQVNIPPFSMDQGDLVSLLCRDLVNSYGIRAPSRLESDISMIRGTALYLGASRINHECLPNVARCENFDRNYDPNEPGRNMWMELRTLHALPAGEEITQSYFPLGWDMSERQTRCKDIYGFSCACPRCALESEGAIECDSKEVADAGYVGVFLFKYMCPDSECAGTMVPIPRDDQQTSSCNVCGRSRTEAQFMEDFQAGF